tara:strand:+ start:537 stop:2666 length:2130 start_codon:yes stop_codon:yes gene_type:complete
MNLRTSKEKNRKYIRSIDGLRAFAVVAVILNHFNKDFLSSGYLGVDIFFVISGYVITLSLTNANEKSLSKFLLSFYFKRIKRLIPALIFFIVPTSILICFFNPKPVTSLYTGMTSLFGLSNIYLFYKSTDYFGQSAELNPFTHTWSLGIEEQFYIFFPFLLWFTGYSRDIKNSIKNLIFILSILFILSLFSFYYFYGDNHPASYFLISSRCWEIIAGCITFLLFGKRYKVENIKIWNKSSNISLLLLSIILLMPSQYNYISTPTIVLLTCNLLSNIDDLRKNKLLNQRILVFIGKISFSLYLWHWGIISLSKWTIGMSIMTLPIQILLIILLSYFSYAYVENPIRRIKSTNYAKGYFVGISSIGIAFLGLKFVQQNYLDNLYLGKKIEENLSTTGMQISKKYSQLVFKDSGYEKACNPCHWTCGQISKRNIEKCGNTKLSNKNKIWIVGDSHSSYLQPAGAYLANKLDYDLFIFGKAGNTFPSQNFKLHEKYDSSLNYVLNLKKEQTIGYEYLINNFKSKDIIIITQRFPLYFGPDFEELYDTNKKFIKFYDSKNNQINREQFYKIWLKDITKFLEIAKSKSVNVFIISPLPEFPEIYFRRNFSDCGTNWFNKPFNYCRPSDKELFYKKSFYFQREGIYDKFKSDFSSLEKQFSNLKIINMFEKVCSKNKCSYSDNSINLYADHNHISKFTSWEIFGPEILSSINKMAK